MYGVKQKRLAKYIPQVATGLKLSKSIILRLMAVMYFDT
jgi:hypothetical protein